MNEDEEKEFARQLAEDNNEMEMNYRRAVIEDQHRINKSNDKRQDDAIACIVIVGIVGIILYSIMQTL